MISIITPTIRDNEALKLVAKALSRQTFRDFEWIIGSPTAPKVIEDCKFDATWCSDSFVDGISTLNRMYNELIRNARYDLIISWQDYTYTEPDTLERFLTHYTQEPKTLVTAVGNKYSDSSWTVVLWKDPRERNDQGTYYQCHFNDIEANLCSFSRKAIYDVGGFDEKLDFLGYGMDAYSVFDRLNMVGGYDFKIDQSIKSYSLVHGRPENWEKLNNIHGPYEKRRKAYFENPRLDYLI